MNERQPYEKHLADKLHTLPPPGEPEQTWEQMRDLLDKEMPRGGGIIDRRRWVLFSIAIGVLFLATWLSGGSYLDRSNTDSVAQATAPPGTPPDRPAAGYTPAQPPDDDPGITSTGKNKTNDPLTKHRNPNADDAIFTLKNNTAAQSSGKLPVTTAGAKPGKVITLPSNGAGTAGNMGSTANTGVQLLPATTGTASALSGMPAPHRQELQSAAVQVLPASLTGRRPVLAPGITLDKDYVRKKAWLPQPPATGSARKKMPRVHQAGTFAVGFSLPLAFPLGDQKAMGYNVWAGHNTVSDYLPSPHLQYHLNSKTFIQTEAQLASPQFIRSTLLFETTQPLGTGYYTTNSVYAKKLYYFNVPVSIHHSPFPGFYMGTGIQFSSMLSGVAMSERRKWDMGGNYTLISETYSRFRNDTLSRRINGNEFRVLLDANYYFDRFTVGLRYNQALSNYISFRLAPGIPYSFEKNRALQFYLRYNLWEEKKRAMPYKTMLTLK